VSKKTVMFVSFALLAAGAFAIAAAASVGALYAIAILLGVGWGAYYAVDWALACNLVGKGRAGALMAIWNIGSSGPQVLSPVIGGLLVDRIGGASGDLGAGYRMLFILVGAYVVAGALALIFVREHTAGKARETG
jgi:MFS family permease